MVSPIDWTENHSIMKGESCQEVGLFLENFMNICLECDALTKNPKFCNKSCSAKFNNRRTPKQAPKGQCAICGKVIWKRLVYCRECNTKTDWANITLADIKFRHLTQYATQIRYHARKQYKRSGRKQACENCGYSKHFEVCHIKSIHTFSDDSKIEVINHSSNLIALCRNCHWEFDHGILIL
jgi:hypothetical protein